MNDSSIVAVSAAKLRTVFIVNPVSGRVATRAERRPRLENFIRQHRLDGSIELTRRAGHATELARAAAMNGAQLIASVGGDGTLNEVARALVGSDVFYGIIPLGSGNGLARDLGLPLDFNQALAVLLDGTARPIDTGEVNGLPFFNVMGLGFDAEVGRRFNLSKKRGFLSYLKIGLKAWFAYRKEPLVIEPEDGAPIAIDAFVTAIANSSQYGNNARIAPRARLDDGRLDLAAITTRNPFASLTLVTRLFRGTLDRSHWVRSAQATRFVIRRRASGPVHTDGEVHDCDAVLDISIRPRSLRVVVPRS
jgi:YegS/Rv2252/BmrU family lipid kinase